MLTERGFPHLKQMTDPEFRAALAHCIRHPYPKVEMVMTTGDE